MEHLRSLDYFQHLSSTVSPKKTVVGGLLSLLTFSLLLILLVSETCFFFSGETKPHPTLPSANHVDNLINSERIRANLNISFFGFPCPAISLDYQDVTGTFYPDIEHSIYKLSLSKDGILKGEEHGIREKIKKSERKYIEPSWPMLKYHGLGAVQWQDSTDCYGASLYKGQLCKTCQDVIEAYAMRNWPRNQPTPFPWFLIASVVCFLRDSHHSCYG